MNYNCNVINLKFDSLANEYPAPPSILCMFLLIIRNGFYTFFLSTNNNSPNIFLPQQYTYSDLPTKSYYVILLLRKQIKFLFNQTKHFTYFALPITLSLVDPAFNKARNTTPEPREG